MASIKRGHNLTLHRSFKTRNVNVRPSQDEQNILPSHVSLHNAHANIYIKYFVSRSKKRIEQKWTGTENEKLGFLYDRFRLIDG